MTMTEKEQQNDYLPILRDDVILSFPMTEDEFEEKLIRIQEERTERRRRLLEAKKEKKKAEFDLEALDRIEEKLRSGYKEQLDKDDEK